jgi:uncharacterized membrane protein HdeD (DUF308 family)
MNKIFYYALSGQFLVFAGLILFFSHKIDLGIIIKLVPILLVLTGSCMLGFSLYQQLPNHANRLHFVQGIGCIVFGVFLLIAVDTFRKFFLSILCFVIVFGLFEILFAFLTRKNIPQQILVSRFMAGILNFLGGILIFILFISFQLQELLYLSILLTLAGISMLIFASKVRKYLHESDN